MINKKISDDVATITSIKTSISASFMSVMMNIIGEYILEAIRNDESEISVDMEFGVLKIKIIEDGVKYRFEPSKKMNNMIRTVIDSEISPIEGCLERAIAHKIEKTYKDVII